jgi:hypothetical protein
LFLAADLILYILAASNNPKPSSDAAIAGKIKLVSEAPVAASDRGTATELALLPAVPEDGGGLVATSHWA